MLLVGKLHLGEDAARAAWAPRSWAEPNLQIGPFRGFDVIRRMLSATQIKNGPELLGPSMLHQIWLSRGGTALELQGYALESKPGVQRAIDAMVGSLSAQT